jgi:hypothetical protein
MKTMMLMCLAFALTVSCQKEKLADPLSVTQENTTSESVLTEGIQGPLSLNENGTFLEGFAFVNFYEAHEAEKMMDDIAFFISGGDELRDEEVYDIPERGRIQVRRVLSQTSGLIDAYAVTILDGPDVDIDTDILTKACDTKSKDCCSKSCVKDTLLEIYEADRDVDVTYRRGMVCRTITWVYQDC